VFKTLNKIDQPGYILTEVHSQGRAKKKTTNTFSKKELSKQLEAKYSKPTTTEILRLYKIKPSKQTSVWKTRGKRIKNEGKSLSISCKKEKYACGNN